MEAESMEDNSFDELNVKETLEGSFNEERVHFEEEYSISSRDRRFNHREHEDTYTFRWTPRGTWIILVTFQHQMNLIEELIPDLPPFSPTYIVPVIDLSQLNPSVIWSLDIVHGFNFKKIHIWITQPNSLTDGLLNHPWFKYEKRSMAAVYIPSD